MGDKCNDHSGCMADIKHNNSQIVELWKALNGLSSRVPVWVAWTFAAGGGVIGCLVTIISVLINKAG